MGNREQPRTRVRALMPFLLLLSASTAWAADPPKLVNYQGVLRSSADAPLDGNYDMQFRFWNAEIGGVEIMLDRHIALTGNAVTVTGGLFNVLLGGGYVTDGSGPGTYTSPDAVFRDYSGVWLEVSVGGETLEPRTRIQSAPYAFKATTATTATNATQLAGLPASSYLDTSATPQTKFGPVIIDDSAGGAGGDGAAIEAIGTEGGGYFRDSDGSAYAIVGGDQYGIEGRGTLAGAWFEDLDGSGFGYIGRGDIGVVGWGDTYGGFFSDSNGSGRAYLGYDDYGIQGFGDLGGGYFSQNDVTSYAFLGYGGYGVSGYGNTAGGFFQDLTSAAYAYVGFSTFKIQGTGTVSFVQNHPTRKDRVIVYAAPEGDEVAVYTRGSARLVSGRADVALDTFALVANPDLGLTAHLTPHGVECAPYVVSISTSRLVVGTDDPRCAGIDFDYMVYGLRIGFESLPIVQVKNQEAYLPTAASLAELEAGQTDAVASSALQRYRASHERLSGAPTELSRANALATQINEGREEWLAARAEREEERRAEQTQPRETGAVPFASPAHHPDAERMVATTPTPIIEVAAETQRPTGTTLVLRAAVAIEMGEVASLDPLHPGTFVRSSTPGEALIAGCTLTSGDGEADIEIATAGVALCRADASAAPINVGDLLIASPLAGHAMKHDGTLAAPAILGRAVDPLPIGTELIRVLLGAR